MSIQWTQLNLTISDHSNVSLRGKLTRIHAAPPNGVILELHPHQLEELTAKLMRACIEQAVNPNIAPIEDLT